MTNKTDDRIAIPREHVVGETVKIEMHPRPTARIEEFADKYGLIMEVHERSARDYCAGPWLERFRYFAHFKRAEIKEGRMLSSASGDGATPEEAIADYARNISGQLLIIDAYRDERCELHVPMLVAPDPAALEVFGVREAKQ